ncbi:MAG: hypothetical protein PVH19_07205 [Planctomycetia bacterium]|jgi:hypothetical protein
MKNAVAMVENDFPPDWIIILDELGRFFYSRTRVVVAEDTTIDFEPDIGDSPSTTILTDEPSRQLDEILAHIEPDTNLDASNNVIDGSPCAVAIINGKSKWVSFGEFNLAGMPSDELLKLGPQIAMFLRALSQELKKA